MLDIGTHLKILRNKKGLSMKAVHKVTGISDSTVSNIENNNTSRDIPVKTLLGLADLYEVNLIDLLIIAKQIPQSHLEKYQKEFVGVDQLSILEREYVQRMIDYIIASHGKEKEKSNV